MRIKTLVGAAALTVAGSVLTACGGGGSSDAAGGDYCSQLKSDKAFFASFEGSGSDLGDLGEAFTRMHTLADNAPDEVADDWKTLDGALTTIENALKEAGLKPSDLGGLQNGQVPAGVDAAKLQALLPKLEALSSSNVGDAAQRIASNAKDKCGVDLNGS